MKQWGKFLPAYLLLFFFASSASAQGSFFTGTAYRYTPAGIFAASGAGVTICTSSGSGSPCTPTITVYKDAALANPVANPLPVCSGTPPQFGCIDGLGNFSFYASTPGPYTYTITGAGLSPYGPIPIYSSLSPSANLNLTGAVTIQPPGSLTVSGTGTFTGLFQCKNFEGGAACVDNGNSQGWSGADICAWITSAQASLASTGGVVDVYLASGAFAACAGTFAVGSTTQGVTVQIFGAGEIDVQNTIIVNQGSKLLGQNGGSGNLGTTPTVIGAGSSFPTSGVYLVQMGPTSGTADGPSLRDLQLNLKNVALSKGINVSNMQDMGDITDVFILHPVGDGIDVTGSSQNFRIANVIDLASSSATADSCLTIGSSADHVSALNFGCTSNAASPSSAGGIVCTGCNMSLISPHIENHADGVLLTGSGNGAVTIQEIDNAVAMTNLVHVASTWNGTLNLNAAHKFIGTNTVKNDLTAFNHVCPDVALNKYSLGANVGQPGAISLDTDCTTLSSIRSATLAISGGAAGNFTPDATTGIDLRYPSATFNGNRMDDITNSTSWYYGPGVGSNVFGFRDRVNGKNMLFLNQSASGGTATLPTACTTTVSQSTLNPAVVLPICGMTSQKTETGTADANVLTFTPPAVAGTYRACVVVSVSSATSGIISWSLNWTDSNGNAQSNVAQDLFQQGTPAPNTTFTTSAAGNYNGCSVIDVNNAAASIIVKWVGGGTTAAKVSATIERVI